MELQIIKDKTNPQLKRREASIKIISKGTPSRIEVKNKLAALANSKPELIVIERLESVFGKQEVWGEASIYESEDRLKQVAHQHLLARGMPNSTEEKAAETIAAVKEPETKAEAKNEPEKK